jgi:UDP-N-acetylglucosamine transferase subunit ALG13
MNEGVFKQMVVQYCELDDKVKEHNKRIKELKVVQKDMTESIMNYMSERSLEVCKAGEYGVLTLKTVSSKAPLNVETVRENLSKILGDQDMMRKDPEDLATSGAEYIVNNREVAEKKSLRRSMVKK